MNILKNNQNFILQIEGKEKLGEYNDPIVHLKINKLNDFPFITNSNFSFNKFSHINKIEIYAEIGEFEFDKENIAALIKYNGLQVPLKTDKIHRSIFSENLIILNTNNNQKIVIMATVAFDFSVSICTDNDMTNDILEKNEKFRPQYTLSRIIE